MDLLGSILNSMDKPPEANQKQKEIIKSSSPENFNHFFFLIHLYIDRDFVVVWMTNCFGTKNKNFFLMRAHTEQNEHIEKMRNREKEELNRFRQFVEERIDRISKDDSRKFIQFQPLDKVYRSVV